MPEWEIKYKVPHYDGSHSKRSIVVDLPDGPVMMVLGVANTSPSIGQLRGALLASLRASKGEGQLDEEQIDHTVILDVARVLNEN